MEGAKETIADGPVRALAPWDWFVNPCVSGNPIFAFERVMALAIIFDLLVALLGPVVDEKMFLANE